MDIGTIISLIIVGAIIGALARFFLPGKQAIGLIATIVVGIVGTLIGYWIAGQLGVKETSGVDWLKWIICIIVSMVLVAITTRVMSRSNHRTLA